MDARTGSAPTSRTRRTEYDKLIGNHLDAVGEIVQRFLAHHAANSKPSTCSHSTRSPWSRLLGSLGLP